MAIKNLSFDELEKIDIILEKLVPNSSTYIKLIAKGNHDKLLKFGMKLQLSFITMEMKFELMNTSTYEELHFILTETSFEEVTDILSTDFIPSELYITIE